MQLSLPGWSLPDYSDPCGWVFRPAVSNPLQTICTQNVHVCWTCNFGSLNGEGTSLFFGGFFVFGFTCLKSVLCQVFIHCSTSVCTPTPADSCVWSCNRKSECYFYLMVCGILEPFSDFLLSCRERCWETSRGYPYSCLQWRNYP